MLWVLMTAALLAALMAAPIIIEIKSCRKRFFTIRLKVFGLPALKKTVYLHLRRYIRPEIVLVKRGGAFKRIYSFSLKSIINKKRSKKIDYTAFMPELRFIDASIVLGAENIAVSCMRSYESGGVCHISAFAGGKPAGDSAVRRAVGISNKRTLYILAQALEYYL